MHVERATARQPATGEGTRDTSHCTITWLGHATCLIDMAGVRLLTDPLLRDRLAFLQRWQAAPDARDLRLDAVLVSHAHPDHLDPHSLDLIPRNVTVIAPAGADRIAAHHGRYVHTIERDAAVEIGNRVTVRSAPAVHDPRRHPLARRSIPGIERPEAVGFLVESNGFRVYFAGDTELYEGMAELASVDVALLPVGGWWRALGVGHMDGDQAACAAALVEAHHAIPVHWGTFHPYFTRRILADTREEQPARFVAALERLSPATVAHVLQPGESVQV